MSNPTDSPDALQDRTEYVSALAKWQVVAYAKTEWRAFQFMPQGADTPGITLFAKALRRFSKAVILNPEHEPNREHGSGVHWSIRDDAGVSCLGGIRDQISPEKTAVLIRKLGFYLAALHEHGLFCNDISPRLVFACKASGEAVVLPTFLASTDAVAVKGEGTYVSPELRHEIGAIAGDARSDVYGLGQLTWTLLTGQQGRNPSFALPSDVNPSLGDWDEFIDATCRAHPERRSQGIQEALALLPSTLSSRKASPTSSLEAPAHQASATERPGSAKQQRASPERLRRPHTSPLIPRRLLLTGSVLAGAWALTRWAGSRSGAKRGFADTIIRYPDRSYEGTSWKRIHSAESLRGVMPSQSCNYIHFTHLLGHDDDNLWLAADRDRTAVFFQLTNGHWEYRQTVGERLEWHDTDCLVQRPHLLAPERLVPCVEGAFYEVTPSAVRKIPTSPKDDTGWTRQGASGVAIITEDYYFHTRGEGSLLDSYVVKNGKATLLDDGTKKEAFIYSAEFNAPLEEYRVASIAFPASFSRGHCIGVCTEDEMAKIVEFRDGRWWDKGDVVLTKERQNPAMESGDIRDAFFGTLDGRTPGYAILCGLAGTVIYRDFNGTEEERSVVPRQETTTAELIRAWGAGPEKYWVMDAKGEVWERHNGQTRVVVRGMHDSEDMDSDRGFRTAWISPSGNVFAATKEHLFKLS